MGPQKFTASNTAEALKMVKAKMGPDAMVLSTKDTDQGVEILAITPEDLSNMSNDSGNPAASSSSDALREENRDAGRDFRSESTESRFEELNAANLKSKVAADTVRPISLGARSNDTAITPISIADALQNKKRKQSQARQEPQVYQPHEETIQPAQFPTLSKTSNAVPAAPSEKSASLAPSSNVEQLLSEISEVKQLLQSHVAGSFWSSMQQETAPHAEIVKHLLNVGFSPKLCADIVKNLPSSNNFQTLLQEARSQVAGLIRTIDSFSIFDQGGVFAFIGPTGVGKTTTVAKIAARCVLRYGRNQVALLTTDTYRIGAQEQLKVFAKILGLPVVSLRDSDDLAAKLRDLSSRKVILLDTAGVSQRDTLMVEQSQMLQDGSRNAFRILVMSSTTDLRTQEDVIHLHNQAARAKDMPGIGAAVITKTDEATQLAPVIDCLIRNNLPLMFLSNGQRVPEDLSQPDIAYLSHRAMRSRSYSDDLSINDDQIPAVLSDHLGDWLNKVAP